MGDIKKILSPIYAQVTFKTFAFWMGKSTIIAYSTFKRFSAQEATTIKIKPENFHTTDPTSNLRSIFSANNSKSLWITLWISGKLGWIMPSKNVYPTFIHCG